MRTSPFLALAVAIAVLAPIQAATAGEVDADLMTGLYANVFSSDAVLNPVGVAAGQKVSFGGTFHIVTEDDASLGTWSNTRELLEGVWKGQATPFANVIVDGSAASIAAGNHDAAIARWVVHVKEFLDRGGKRSLIVAPLQEHNGDWTPWGCDPANYKSAYRKFVDAFATAGIGESQVRFAWAPNGWTTPGCGSLKDYYPGDDIVDIVAISAYNFGTCVSGGRYESPSQAFDPYLDEIRDTIPGASSKPFMIAQTASPRPSCGGDQSAWVRTMIEHLDDDPNVVGFVWFNFLKETDWRVWTGSSLTSGWTEAVSAGHTAYQWPLTDWFTPGDLTVGPPAPEVVPCGAGPCDSITWVDPGGIWGLWDGLYSSSPVSRFYYGNPGDLPFMGDWDGDGIETPGLFRQSDGYVYVRHTNTQGNANITFFFGNPGDVPLVGDFDGDGRDSVSIWRIAQARVYIIDELGEDGKGLGAADYSYDLESGNLVPFVGDFDGDGVDTIGFYDPSDGFVSLRNSNSAGPPDAYFRYGNPGDQILVGDWDGDGDDTVGVYRPSSGRFYLNLENAAGASDWDGYIGTYPWLVTQGRR
jgi:hypothetical protein